MDDAIRQARESRQAAADFFSANPGQQYLCAGGAVHTPDGCARFYGTSTRLLPPDMTAAEAHRIAGERGQALYITPDGDTLCTDSPPPGAVRVWVTQQPARTPSLALAQSPGPLEGHYRPGPPEKP